MTTLFASESGGTVSHGGREIKTFGLQTAINRLIAGDTLHVLPGRYTRPVTISHGGEKGAPIVIKGSFCGGTIFDGVQVKESAANDFDPMDDDFAFIKIMGADWVNISNIRFERCWPSAVFIRGAKQVSILESEIYGGRFGVYARNRSLGNKARHIALRKVKWVQDVDHDMWEGRITWMDVKQTTRTQTDARFFNGALFGSYDIKGPVTIEDCDVSHAFNGIRLDAKNRNTERGRNKDVRILRCRFHYIRDNAIEPEKVAENLFILDSTFFNVHAVFSLDAVGGKNWYYFGNRVLNLRKPGLAGQPNRGGKIFKFHSDGPYPMQNFVVAFNSIQTRTGYIKSGQTRNMLHTANAIGICRRGPDCASDRKMLGDDFVWHPSLRFLADLCDHPDYPDVLNTQGFEVSGMHTPIGTFDLSQHGVSNADWDGHLPLRLNSPGVAKSQAFTVQMPDGKKIHLEEGKNIGAPAPCELLAMLIQKVPVVDLGAET